MPAANQQSAPSESSRANGQTHLHDLFALSDEQILEIDPVPQDVSVAENVSHGDSPAAVTTDANGNASRAAAQAQDPTQSTQAGVPVLHEPPAWLAETMNDPQRGAEARALWEGAQRAEREAASYREVFAKPEEARAAAERARVLDDIDRAYFVGDAAQRAQLAAMMMREDPAAFREMVFEGLRALEQAGTPVRNRSVADALGRPSTMTAASAASQENPGHSSPAPTAQANRGTVQGHTQNDSAQQAHVAAYAAFEKAANEDLERSVGTSIERTLEQALPAANRPDGAALKGRMAAAIRQDVEKALQGDRQLGEQIAQILSAKRLDSQTREQVVRLIGERAQQLVPTATRRALNDWTQTTLAAHRGKNARSDAASAGRGVTPAAPVSRDTQLHSAQRKDASRSVRAESKEPSKGPINYRRLSDEQILDL
ncbi:MAG: hypothetical protein WA817_22210 [Candidatus Acidiferrum sp.]